MTDTRPNILWICSDQQRFDTLGCYGNNFVETPHTDQLAADGMLFQSAYSQSPVCTPSRASFLTGRYPRTTRCRQNGQSIPEDEVLVTKLLADAGYICGLSGKLHISTCNPSAQKGTERRIDDGYDEFHWSHHPRPNDWPTNEYIHWLQARGQTYQVAPYNGSQYVQAGMPAEHHQTTWCAQKAIDFIETNARFDQPWLFSVNIFDPHHPFDPPVEYLERYLDKLDSIPLPNYSAGELENKPIFQQIDHQGSYHNPATFAYDAMSDEDHRLTTAAYWAMCDLIDTQVGRMLDALKRSGQLENTIVIFMSDHGEMLGDHGIYWKGPYFYEPAIHVPLIIAQPGVIEAGQISTALVELVDLAPTLLEAAGLPVYPGMQGQSLWPMLTGSQASDQHREDVYCEYYNAMPWHREPLPQFTMVRDQRYKLVIAHGLDTGELYDLESDPAESTNLWDDAAYVNIKLAMYRRLTDRMAWTVDPLPMREADW